MRKKTVVLLLAAAIAASIISACANLRGAQTEGVQSVQTVQESEKSSQETEKSAQEAGASAETAKQGDYLGQGTVGDQWYCSSIAGVVSGETRVSLKDDYYTAVNLEYLAGLSIEDGFSSAGVFRDADKIMTERTLTLLKDGSPKNHEGKLVSSLYELTLDWEKRNETGIKPITANAERIRAIRTVEDLIAYETDREDTFSVTLAEFQLQNSMADPGNYTVGILSTPLFLDFSNEYFSQSEDGKLSEEYSHKVVGYMLDRLGLSREEADQVWKGCLTFERAIAEHIMTREEIYSDDVYDKVINVCTLKDLKKIQGNYPLVEILDAYGMAGSDTYNLYEPRWLSALGQLYTEKNVENIKDYLLAHYVFQMVRKLDRDAYDAALAFQNERYGITGSLPEEEIGLSAINAWLSEPMDYVYIDAYCTREERQRVIDLIHDFAEYYRKMLEQEDWLSDSTKQCAIEKLDNLTIRACYSDTREDYSRLDFASKAEGGTYIEALQAINRHNWLLQQEKLNQKVNPDIWEMSTREVNAYYSFKDNSINILCGTLVGVLSMDQPEEAVLATVGAQTIGHEISHAFDTNGAQFDKDGNYSNWWEETDYAAFNERADRLVAYMNQIIPCTDFQPVNGEMQKTEMIADLGGMKAALMMARDKENFDYDAFFRAAARGWAVIETKNSIISQQQKDPHPLNYLRVNIPLQNSDEFMETYDIQPGDGMYLDPEDRVNVW